MRQIMKQHAHLKRVYLSKVMLVTIIWEQYEGEPALVTARYAPYACSETVIKRNQFRNQNFL